MSSWLSKTQSLSLHYRLNLKRGSYNYYYYFTNNQNLWWNEYDIKKKTQNQFS
jgi:hypothetical protein